jgi:serpin B
MLREGALSEDDILLSPLSITTALLMAANGAEGETRAQFEELFGMSIEKMNEELFKYYGTLTSNKDAKFNFANSMWVTNRPDFNINENFLHEIENTFEADVFCAPFTDPETVKSINGWVWENTDKMIPEILGEDDVSYDTIMVLLNALSFDALWSDPVPDEACFDGKFNGKGGESTVKYMNASARAYIEGEHEIGIVKEYRGGGYAFVALLPKEGDISSYLRSLDGERFVSLYDKREYTTAGGPVVNVSAKLPHFKTDTSLSLRELLCSLGIVSAFDNIKADFSSLGKMDGGENIYISNVLHKTFLELDNSGTRAAAVTAVIMDAESAEPISVKNYRVEFDRPFVYAIVDTKEGLPIFLGVCNNIEG